MEKELVTNEKIKENNKKIDKEKDKKIITYPNFDDIKKLHELHVR